MDDVKITLAFLWVALMLIYLLGDVLRIFAGEIVLGEIEGKKLTPGMVMGMAILMVIPIIMIILSIMLDQSANRTVNIVVALFWFVFNLISIKGYAPFDKFLLVVSLGVNALTIWYAWKWV
jgi:phage-related holin